MDTIRMLAPEGATSCTHNGVIYEVIKGFVHVMHDAVAALKHHGYRVEAEVQAEAEKLAKAEAERKAQLEKLEDAIAIAPKAIQAGTYKLEECVDEICGFYPFADRATVTSRVTEGVQKLQADADAETQRVADEKAKAEAEAKAKAEAEAGKKK